MSPIVVLSGLDDETLAVRAVHEGAQDYLVKGQVDGGAILRSMRYAIERQRLEAVRRDLERQRDEFFSSVSHDLRTPVAAIKAAIGVVLANVPADMRAGSAAPARQRRPGGRRAGDPDRRPAARWRGSRRVESSCGGRRWTCATWWRARCARSSR